MKPVAVVGAGAVSALGAGAAAYSVGRKGEPAVTAIREDDELRHAGLVKPFVARVDAVPRTVADRATELLSAATRSVAEQLDDRMPGWRAARLGVAVGTSSGGMISLTRALARRAGAEAVEPALAAACPYFGPLRAIDDVLGAEPLEQTQVLAACASSAVAIGVACRWLELGRVDLALAGGYDAVSVLVAAGFESLGATSASRPAPFRSGRDGMALGEGACLLALVRASESAGRACGYVRGFAATCDAVHVTAPDREGLGLAIAAERALEDAALAPWAVDLVSAHATATPFNDAAESRALARVLGDRLQDVVVHPWKAVAGHTLGASSALELLAALDAMSRGVLPAAAGEGPLDPELPVKLLERNAEGRTRICLKLSAAFGGANAALVASTEAGDGVELRSTRVGVLAVGGARGASDLGAVASRVKIPQAQVSRLDPLSAAAVAAVASALEHLPSFDPLRTGVVVGTATASLENDAAFFVRLHERGPRGVEPRKFPPTSPNLPAGQCAIAFGLRGPSLSVGGGHDAPIEALLFAHDLVAAGDAERMVVVAAEHVAALVSDLWGLSGWPVPVDGAAAVVLGGQGGTPLDRAVLSGLRREVRSNRGRLGTSEAGWPCLLSAVSRATAG